ncbi:hypothetical protein ACIQAA_27500 [Neobacillus sp. NPDC093182]|uniref:hypothetical protein n=1 Tax=Neobacillus sp. NPDC093182 TaxID=3364297 RepID=UPI003811280B
MKESVGEKVSRNTVAWLQYVNTREEELTEKQKNINEGVMEMKMMNKDRPGICYSNISLIKKALLQNSENILPYHEILLYVKKNWTNLNSKADDIKGIVDLALYAPKSFFYEVDEGLWGIKDKTDARLNQIYNYMNPIKIPLKISDMKQRLRFYESEDMLKQLLLSDIRFSQIENTPFWILSEWIIINNFVYEYIFNSDLIGIDREKVVERVVQLNKLDKDKIIFLPLFDDRFSVIGNRVEIKRMMGINENSNVEQEVEVPVEINEEVGRLSYKIINFIKGSKEEVTTSQIVMNIFQITQNEPSFSIYSEAIKDLLDVVPEIKQVEAHKWTYSEDVTNLQIENRENVYYAVKNSTPTIKNLKELMDQVHPNSRHPINVTSNDTKKSDDKLYAYHTISYYDRVKGFFIIPKGLIEKSVLFRQNNHGKIMIQYEEFRYEWNWENNGHKYYFFGDGVMDFFADYLIEPGHKLSFAIDNQIMYLIRVHKVGFDERYASEQQRYLDIGRLVEESKSVNKSIFSLMCETLAIHPSGMHWSVLLDKIAEKRTTTKNTVTNLLSRNECFEQVEGKKGYWRLSISKLSRYYINEENQEIVEPVESGKKEENESLKVVRKEEFLELLESGVEENEPSDMDIKELQQLDTDILIQQIESKLMEITQEETKFKESISERVHANFINGNISAIEELYKSVEFNIKFYERVRLLAQERERKSEE